MTLEPGTTLGRYQILAPLGHGGMATVYRAYQPALERVVALKVLRADFSADPEFRERFEREAKAVARLRHPHIVQVFDFDSDQGHYFMAMDYLEGGTLKAKLAELSREGRGLPPQEAGRLVAEVAEALSFAHEAGIVHRDVKPSNVLLTRAGHAVVSDFGIARLLAATQHTQSGVGVGTPEYMSPEQGQGRPVDHRSDIYSLGIVAYELLTGSVPFQADTPLAVVYAHAHDPLPLPSRRNPQIGPKTERVLLRALAKDPAERYARATDFGEALARALEAEARETPPTVVGRGSPLPAAAAPATAHPLRPPAVARLPRWLALAGGALLVLLLAAEGAALLGVFGRVEPVAPGPERGAPAPQATPTSPAATAGAALATSTSQAPATSRPTATPSVTIPKGRLVFEAKLDGSQADIRDSSFTVGSSEVVSKPGAIELNLAQPGTSAGTTFNAPALERYVGELEFSMRAGMSACFTWFLREAAAGRPHQNISMSPNGSLQFTYWAGGGSGPAIPISARVTVPALLTTDGGTLSVLVDPPTFRAYAEGRQILEARDERVTGSLRPRISLGECSTASGPGGVRITGARFYELAPAVATATATLPPPAPPTPASQGATPSPPPTWDPGAPRFEISGRVSSAADGRSLPNVTVHLIADTGWCCYHWLATTTSAQGTYMLKAPSGGYFLRFDPTPASGHAGRHWRNSVRFGDAMRVAIATANVAGLDIVLPTGFSVGGTVRNAAGSPVANASVVVQVESPESVNHVTGIATDSSGRYSLRLTNGAYRIGFYPRGASGDPPGGWVDLVVSGRDVTLDQTLP